MAPAMSTTLWDTTGSDITASLAAERHRAGGIGGGQALTLVIVVAEHEVAAAEQAATIAGQAHPSRLLLVVRRPADASDRLDAEVSVGGRLGPAEAVIMRMYGRLALHAESVVLPLLAPDAPVVAWWHGPPPDEIAADSLGTFAGRRITDCALAPDPLGALHQRAADYASGDTDLAWTRCTPWRALLAGALDPVSYRATAASVTGEAGNPSVALLAGWLSARLGVQATCMDGDGPGITTAEVAVETSSAAHRVVTICRPDGRSATLSVSGEMDRQLPLTRRRLGDLLTEELRRLEPDPVYAEALAAATATADLDARPSSRRHIWRDPMAGAGS